MLVVILELLKVLLPNIFMLFITYCFIYDFSYACDVCTIMFECYGAYLFTSALIFWLFRYSAIKDNTELSNNDFNRYLISMPAYVIIIKCTVGALTVIYANYIVTCCFNVIAYLISNITARG